MKIHGTMDGASLHAQLVGLREAQDDLVAKHGFPGPLHGRFEADSYRLGREQELVENEIGIGCNAASAIAHALRGLAMLSVGSQPTLRKYGYSELAQLIRETPIFGQIVRLRQTELSRDLSRGGITFIPILPAPQPRFEMRRTLVPIKITDADTQTSDAIRKIQEEIAGCFGLSQALPHRVAIGEDAAPVPPETAAAVDELCRQNVVNVTSPTATVITQEAARELARSLDRRRRQAMEDAVSAHLDGWSETERWREYRRLNRAGMTVSKATELLQHRHRHDEEIQDALVYHLLYTRFGCRVADIPRDLPPDPPARAEDWFNR